MTTEQDTFNKLRRTPGDAMLAMLEEHYESSGSTILWPAYITLSIKDNRGEVIKERDELLEAHGWTHYLFLSEYLI